MRLKVQILDSAMDDLRAGRRFYARQGGRDLGLRFLETLSETIGRLSDSGGMHARQFGFYRALAAKFPYSVYYDVEGDVVRVYAVVDNRRNPAWVESHVAGDRVHAEAQRESGADGAGAWFVREGDAPEYGEAAKGAKREVVYLDACFVSHWVGQDLDDPAQLAKHEATVACWKRLEGKATPVVSEVVETEISDGKPDGAARRVRRIQELPSWKSSPEAEALTEELLRTGAVRKAKPKDAAHIAVAAVGGADWLLSWNFQDIVNEDKLPLIKSVVERAGFRCPQFASPDKLPEDMP